MNLVLKAELTTDPLARGYSGMSDVAAAASLNTVNRSKNRTSMTGDEIFQQTVPASFNGLSDTLKSQWLAFCGRSALDPFATANVQFVVAVFGAASQTVTNLNAARVTLVSRAQELGLAEILPGHVAMARAA